MFNRDAWRAVFKLPPLNPLTEFFKTRCGLWVSKEFRDWILVPALAMADVAPATAGQPFSLPRSRTDAEICKELGGGHVFENAKAFCLYLAGAIERQWGGVEGDLRTNGYANLFYVRGAGGEVFVVDVCWDAGDREWYVLTYRLEFDVWRTGCRAFPCLSAEATAQAGN